MKKITILLLFLVWCASSVHGQCTNTEMYPDEPVIANNYGIIQQISSCAYTEEYSKFTGISPGGTYTFTCISSPDEGEGVHKYITVRDDQGNVISHGMSPLAVTNLTVTDIEVHYTENAACDTDDECHIISLQAVFPCPIPTDVITSAITTTGVTFGWAPGSTETVWQVYLVPSGDPAPTPTTAGIVVSGTPSYVFTSLDIGEDYCFYVRANCGSTTSPWSNPFCFATACLPIATFNKDFEDDVPQCWTSVLVDSEYASIEVGEYESHSGDKAIEISNGESPSTAKIMLISPPLSTMATGTHRVKFYAKSYNDTTLDVGSVNTMTSDAVFTVAQTISITDAYAEYVVDFSDYAGTNTFLAFRHPSEDAYQSIFLDDIRWELTPLCPDVTAINISGLTTTGATITWTAAATETQWDVVYGDEDDDLALLTPISPPPAGTPTATITGLLSNTSYKVWVRSACGGTQGNGAWIGPVHFTTACLPSATLSEDFDTTEQDDLPDCWSAILSGEGLSEFAYISVAEDDGLDDTNAVRLSNSDSEGDYNLILVSPNVSTLSAGTHRLKFYAQGPNDAMLDIGTISSPTEGGVFTSLQTVQVTDEYEPYTVDFTGYSGTDTYIAMKHVGDMYSGINIDKVRWEVAPLCADVSQIEMFSITTNTAALTWIAGASESQWDVVFADESVTSPAGLIPIAPPPTTSPGATLSGLLPNQSYNVWVRSVCGGAIGEGAWIGPITFKTACLPTGLIDEGFETTEYGELPDCWTPLFYGPTVSNNAEARVVDYNAASGEMVAELSSGDSEDEDFVLLVSPNLNTLGLGTYRLKFSAMSYDPANLEIGTINGTTASSTFTSFEEIVVQEEYGNYVINFDTYTGTDTYIAFRNRTQYAAIFLDDIKWELMPLCPDVTAVGLSLITTSSATVGWTAGGTETGWQVAHGPESATDPSILDISSVLTTASYSLSGLGDDAAYKVWVRSVCGGANGNGAWIGPVVFNTLCLPASLPYVQDFESTDEPDLPGCTTAENLGDGNNWEIMDGPGSDFENNTLVYSFDYDYDADAWFYTRGLPLTAGASYTISYKYGNNSDDDYEESLEVMYGLSPTVSGMTLPIADHPEINTGEAAVNQLTFIAPATGVYYFGFHAYSVANQDRLYVDDISIDVALSTSDNTSHSFAYYPNPVKDKLQLSHSDEIKGVEVYNLLGQSVLKTAVNQNSTAIDMSHLPAGNYIVKVTAASVTKTIKIIKQ